jgi:hypothetical protein
VERHVRQLVQEEVLGLDGRNTFLNEDEVERVIRQLGNGHGREEIAEMPICSDRRVLFDDFKAVEIDPVGHHVCCDGHVEFQAAGSVTRPGRIQLRAYGESVDPLDFDMGLYRAWQLSVPVGPHGAQVSRSARAS